MPVDGHDVRARGIGDLRRQVAQELDVELRGRPGLSTANQIIAGVILLSVLLIVVETEPAIFQPYVTVFLWIEFGLLLFFTLEYLLRLWCAVENPKTFSRFTYALRPLALLDLLVIVTMAFALIGVEGVLLRLLRLVRLLRLAKLGQFSRAFDDIMEAVAKRRYELGISLIIAAVLMLLSASALYVIEGAGQPEAFGSIPRSMWWAVATLTTVGYGDIVPLTALGKAFAAFTALTGIGLIAMPAGILAAAFSEVVQNRIDRERKKEEGNGDGL